MVIVDVARRALHLRRRLDRHLLPLASVTISVRLSKHKTRIQLIATVLLDISGALVLYWRLTQKLRFINLICYLGLLLLIALRVAQTSRCRLQVLLALN